jgi:hypothetical protein
VEVALETVEHVLNLSKSHHKKCWGFTLLLMAQNDAQSDGALCRPNRLTMAQNESLSEGELSRPAFLLSTFAAEMLVVWLDLASKQQNEERLFLLCHGHDEISINESGILDQLKSVDRSIQGNPIDTSRDLVAMTRPVWPHQVMVGST